ncbi:MAG: hypothetical protein WAV07_02070 [Candidatus Contendobacter sp.]
MDEAGIVAQADSRVAVVEKDRRPVRFLDPGAAIEHFAARLRLRLRDAATRQLAGAAHDRFFQFRIAQFDEPINEVSRTYALTGG